MATDSSGNPLCTHVCVCGVTSHTEHVLMESREGDGGRGAAALSDSRSHYAAQELQLQPRVDEDNDEENGRMKGRRMVKREKKITSLKAVKKKKHP